MCKYESRAPGIFEKGSLSLCRVCVCMCVGAKRSPGVRRFLHRPIKPRVGTRYGENNNSRRGTIKGDGLNENFINFPGKREEFRLVIALCIMEINYRVKYWDGSGVC